MAPVVWFCDIAVEFTLFSFPDCRFLVEIGQRSILAISFIVRLSPHYVGDFRSSVLFLEQGNGTLDPFANGNLTELIDFNVFRLIPSGFRWDVCRFDGKNNAGTEGPNSSMDIALITFHYFV